MAIILPPPDFQAFKTESRKLSTHSEDSTTSSGSSFTASKALDFDPWDPQLQNQQTPWTGEWKLLMVFFKKINLIASFALNYLLLELTTIGKCKRFVNILVKCVWLTILLYLFICSLNFLSSSFRLLGGKTAGRVISQNQLLKNPMVGLMIGVLVTVLVQSSSTSTSIVVTMVASECK
jgi:hypothetical protein